MSTSPERSLAVWLDDTRVGRLRETGNLWAFAYDQQWLGAAEGFDLSPSLSRAAGEIVDGASQRPVQWFFDNLLPEEGARTLLARDAGIAPADAFGLLQRYGPESAGALTLLAPGETLPAGGLQALSDEALSARIRNLPLAPLSHDAPKRMSMAGAQHKLAVVKDRESLWEPIGRTASTHILKPDHEQSEHYPHSVANEWFIMRLAEAVGLSVPAVEMRRVPEPVYLVRRFDRGGSGQTARRLHVLDGCQLLSLDRAFKYEQATADTLRKLAEICRAKAATRQSLFRWAVFNAIVGNGDAHLKNLSFLPTRQGVDLAPHYDLISTSVYREDGWGADTLTTPMGAVARFAAVRRDDVLQFGQALGLPQSVGSRLLDESRAAIGRHANALLDAYQALPAGQVDPGEARLLRQIVYGPIRELLAQLT